MGRKNVPDALVVMACLFIHTERHPIRNALDWLVKNTGECEKVCYRAMERALNRDLIEFGVSLRMAWATEKGKNLLRRKDAKTDRMQKAP